MKHSKIPYKPYLKLLARELRNNSTMGEVLLWKKLRNKQFYGYDFHRQKPLLDYIADFYCEKLNLVIEIDGASHKRSDVAARDAQKQEDLAEFGIYVLRFSEYQVRFEMNDVLRSIEDYVRSLEEG